MYDTERNFRLCYAHKWGQPERKLLPVGVVASKRDALQRAMVSHFLDDLPRVEWTLRTIVTVGKGIKRVRQGEEGEPRDAVGLEPGDDSKLNTIRAFARAKWPASNIVGQGKRYKNMLQIALKPGVYCEHAKRVHKNNCTWFKVELPDGNGHLYCTDPDCKEAARWGRFLVDL